MMIASSTRVDAVVIVVGGPFSGERCIEEGSTSTATIAAEHSAKRVRPNAFIRCCVLLLECSTTLMMVVIVEKQTLPPDENRIYDHSSPTPFIIVAAPRPWNALSRRVSEVGTHLLLRPKTDSMMRVCMSPLNFMGPAKCCHV